MILALETSTRQCSVAVGVPGGTLFSTSLREESFVHAEKLHLMVDEVLGMAGIGFNQLTGIRVGRGPGSYTGLRIGVSAAKGYAYARKLPLHSAGTLDVLVHRALQAHPIQPRDVVIPLIDARRMEVYTQVSDHEGRILKPVWAEIISETSFVDAASKGGTCWLVGDCVSKIPPGLLQAKAVLADDTWPTAEDLLQLPEVHLRQEDPFAFEPYYLKEFVALKPKSILGG